MQTGEYLQIKLARTRERKARRKLRDNRLCKCGRERKTYDMHPCPYKEDMNNNHENVCYCCSECRYQCAMDI